METKTYFVIKPVTHLKKKVELGAILSLTNAQATPLVHGGFITVHESAAKRIKELVTENQKLSVEIERLNSAANTKTNNGGGS